MVWFVFLNMGTGGSVFGRGEVPLEGPASRSEGRVKSAPPDPAVRMGMATERWPPVHTPHTRRSLNGKTGEMWTSPVGKLVNRPVPLFSNEEKKKKPCLGWMMHKHDARMS